MLFKSETLRGLLPAAGLWLSASAALAAPQPGPDMPLGREVMPPAAYVAFCERKPLDCGGDASLVLAEAREQDATFAHIRDLIWRARHGLPEPVTAPAALTPGVKADPAPLAVEFERVTAIPIVTEAAFVDPFQARDAERQTRAPRMEPGLWATLNRVNDQVNRAIVQQSDWRTYGQDDYWNTPLEDGRRAGDCEDFVLEKERALVAAGVPRAVLDIAVVLTRWGESHAVLLVSTSDGEYVLDSLTPTIMPWRDAPYQWVSRQVGGQPFRWMSAAPEANEASRPKPHGFLIALLQ